MQLSTVILNLHDAPDIPICDLPLQSQLFTVHIGHIRLDDWVREFHGVIGSDGDLVNCGDYVKLQARNHQVCVDVCV